MIVVNIEELEHISDILSKNANELDDVLNKTKTTLKEMSADIELAQYTQAQSCLDTVNHAKSILFGVNEKIQELKNIMISAPIGYLDKEREYKNEIARMASYLGILSTATTAVLSPNFPVVNNEEQATNQEELQKMVAGNAENLQISNIAALSKIIEKEYPIKQIQEMKDE